MGIFSNWPSCQEQGPGSTTAIGVIQTSMDTDEDGEDANLCLLAEGFPPSFYAKGVAESVQDLTEVRIHKVAPIREISQTGGNMKTKWLLLFHTLQGKTLWLLHCSFVVVVSCSGGGRMLLLLYLLFITAFVMLVFTYFVINFFILGVFFCFVAVVAVLVCCCYFFLFCFSIKVCPFA